MIDYKGIWIISEKEYNLFPLGGTLEGIDEIFPGLYVSPNTKLSKLIEVIELEKEGVFDYAVPESWAKEQGYPKGYDKAVWFYPKEGENRMFGRPFTVREMVARLWLMIKKDHPDFFRWIKENWEVIE